MNYLSVLLFVGILIVVLNKYLAQGLVWWEKNIIGFKDEVNPWVYRVWIIFFGFIFTIIYIIKS